MVVAPTASGADWQFHTFGNARVTVTDNANLAPSGQEKSDVILQGTAGIRAIREGARLKMNISYAPTGVVYLERTNNNTWFNTLSALGSLEAAENFFFIDGRATISQQFLSPFGPTPTDLATATDNRTNVTTLGVSPYIRGELGASRITYLLRNDSNWTLASGTGGNWAYYGNTVARLNGAPAKVSWGLEYNRRNTNFQNQNGFVNDVFRGRLYFTPDPQFQVYGIAGYESNNYSATNRSGAVYGGGLQWQPTERTNLGGFYEERFFGPSWAVNFSHRRPLSYVSLVGYRNESTYPQTSQALAPGDTAAILDGVLISRFPDPVERQAEIQRIIQTLGLPAFLTAPLSFYTQTVFVNQRVTLSLGLTGVRNTVVLAVYTGYSERIPATTDVQVQGVFAAATTIDQRGASGTWSYRLTPLTSMNFLASRTESLSKQPTGAESTTDLFTLNLTRSLGPKTTGTLGFRYTIFDSNVSNDYRAASVFAAVNHTF